jgi:hypothetical protein
MNKAQAKAAIETDSADYKNLIDLLAIYSDADNRLNEIETEANQELLSTIDDKKDDYSKLQAALTTSETGLEIIARRHAAWFAVKKTIKTPYGEVSLKKSTALKIENEEISQVLIEKEIAVLDAKIEANLGRAVSVESVDLLATMNARLTTLKSLLRPKVELNKEALEKLDDADLQRFRIVREEKENFSVKAAKINMGQAVKEAAAKETPKAA